MRFFNGKEKNTMNFELNVFMVLKSIGMQLNINSLTVSHKMASCLETDVSEVATVLCKH